VHGITSAATRSRFAVIAAVLTSAILALVMVLVPTQSSARAAAGAAMSITVVAGGADGGIAPAASTFARPDPVGYRKCLNGAAPLLAQYFENRFNFCVDGYAYVNWTKCIDGVCTKIGEVMLHRVATGVGRNGRQLLTLSVKSTLWTLWGSVNLAQPVTIGDVCINGAHGQCQVTPTHGFTFTVEDWLDPHTLATTFDASGSAGATVGVPNTHDHVNYHEIREYIQVGTSAPIPFVGALPFRCDAAGYAINGGCIFSQVMMTFTLSLSDPSVKAVAEHIEAADKTPGTGTKPPAKGKLIPGFQQTGMPLTRLYPGYDRAIYDNNHRQAVQACIRWFGRSYTTGPKGQRMDCDEYPFRSTYQGVSQAKGKWWYSVLPVPATQNQTAGRRLGAWLTANHILSGDAYWVAVTP
jgi:hypothetical protein